MNFLKSVIKRLKEGDGRTPSQVHATIIGIAGCYLVYLAFDLVTGYSFSEYPLWQAALMVLAIIAFALFGVYFALQGWFEYQRFKNMPLDDDGDEELSEAPADEAEASLPGNAEDGKEE